MNWATDIFLNEIKIQQLLQSTDGFEFFLQFKPESRKNEQKLTSVKIFE